MGDLISGKKKIARALGVEPRDVSAHRGSLIAMGLIVKDGQTMFMDSDSIEAAKAIIEGRAEVPTAPPAPIVENPAEESPYELTTFDSAAHVMLNPVANSISYFHHDRGDQTFKMTLSAAERYGRSFVLKEDNGDRRKKRKSFVRRENIGDVVKIFTDGKPARFFEFEPDDVEGIIAYHSLGVVSEEVSSGDDYSRVDVAIEHIGGISRGTREFYRARFHVARNNGDIVVLVDGKYPVTTDRGAVLDTLRAYFGSRKPRDGRDDRRQRSRSASPPARGARPRTSGSSGELDRSFYVSAVENVVRAGTFKVGERVGRLGIAIREGCSVTPNYLGTLFPYAKALAARVAEQGSDCSFDDLRERFLREHSGFKPRQ